MSLVDGRRAGDRIHRFRIKIWEKLPNGEMGTVVFDNDPTAGDEYAVATAPIDNGSIVIH